MAVCGWMLLRGQASASPARTGAAATGAHLEFVQGLGDLADVSGVVTGLQHPQSAWRRNRGCRSRVTVTDGQTTDPSVDATREARFLQPGNLLQRLTGSTLPPGGSGPAWFIASLHQQDRSASATRPKESRYACAPVSPGREERTRRGSDLLGAVLRVAVFSAAVFGNPRQQSSWWPWSSSWQSRCFRCRRLSDSGLAVRRVAVFGGLGCRGGGRVRRSPCCLSAWVSWRGLCSGCLGSRLLLGGRLLGANLSAVTGEGAGAGSASVGRATRHWRLRR